MSFEFALSEELKAEIIVLAKKDKTITEAINKKIKQIIQSDEFTIDHYKNLKHDLSEYKRVHIMKSFVLLFKVYKEKNFILFVKFGHHDEIYEMKRWHMEYKTYKEQEKSKNNAKHGNLFACNSEWRNLKQKKTIFLKLSKTIK